MMIGKTPLFLVVLCFIASEIASFQWSPASLENGTNLIVCSGSDVILPWFFNTSEGEHMQNVQWFIEQDHDKDIIATLAAEHFFTDCDHMQLEPQAGLHFNPVYANNSGVYSVVVSVQNSSGFCTNFVRVANVTVLEVPEIAVGNLTANQRPGAIQNETTGQWFVQLECGRFSGRGDPPVSAYWTTPSGQIYNSSSYDNGFFVLDLPYPPPQGQYSCAVENTTDCLNDQSFNLALVDIHVPGSENATCDDVVQLQAEIQELQDNQTGLEAEIRILREELANTSTCGVPEACSLEDYLSVDCHYCVKLHFDLKSFNEAMAVCKASGAHLYDIKTDRDADIFKKITEAFGNSFKDLMFLFRIADNTISGIVKETCAAIYAVLKDEFVKVPSTQNEWTQVAAEFERRWNLPNCIGAMDGKHVEIQSPNRGSDYYNYQKFHSIILLAVVDAKYRFIFVDVGANGRAGDAGVFKESSFYAAVEGNRLNIPGPKPLPGRHVHVPHFIVGDDAFPLKTYLMKPFPFRKVMNNINDPQEEIERRKQRIFDYRISRARRLSENAFGILASRFQVFHKAMPFSPETATTMTLACIALHNWLMTKRDQLFAPPTLIDREDDATHELIPGEWRENEHQLRGLDCHVNRTSLNARQVREEINEYVNEQGQVSWQQRIVFGHEQD